MTKPPSHTDHHGGHPSKLLTIPEVAELLRTTDGTLRYWRSTGKGPLSFRVGRHVRYWDTQVVEWLAQQQDNDTANQG
ncbi:MAG: DNA-binding protein [Pseudonocardiales bacterium]|nr:MAG: DNA-binding protein [Pseudonocardiales bacterium]